ncbi:hypothetical protein [Spongiimicrobium sp. 3-5]|uniref:hypothetical protein n=1 Tax=Spongiimicrobium sp. 3-5 TaxID=3332596 RepID=UPI003981577F
MKHIGIFILTLVLLLPPLQVHADVVVYEKAEPHHFLSDTPTHTQNHTGDKGHDNKSEHHHHCMDIHITGAFLKSVAVSERPKAILDKAKRCNFYEATYCSSYLDEVFQPPKGLFSIFSQE